jgi:hypothetical protein
LSQTKNKSGRSDISNLKERLGLKKGGPASQPRGGGVVAPPGMKSRPASVPVPPGARPPAPEIPSAADDPFAAMNMMAAVGAAQKAPEIIIVNDGKPVENVEGKSRAIVMAKYAGMVLIPLIIGIALGQISKSAKQVNATISAAGGLYEDVNTIRKTTQDNILDPLLRAKERGEGGAFKLNDGELTEALSDKKQWPFINPDTAFKAYMYDMDEDLRADIMYFYSDADALVKAVEQHVDQSKNDAKLIEKGQKSVVEAKPDEDVNEFIKKEFSRYGIFIKIPKSDDKAPVTFGARLVEIGPPVCQDRKVSATNNCQGGPPIGFGYRLTGAGDGWDLKEFGQPVGENVPADKLLPLVYTPVFERILKGSEPSMAEIGYIKRVNDLMERSQKLVEYGNALEKKLKAKANQSESFTFFL